MHFEPDLGRRRSCGWTVRTSRSVAYPAGEPTWSLIECASDTKPGDRAAIYESGGAGVVGVVDFASTAFEDGTGRLVAWGVASACEPIPRKRSTAHPAASSTPLDQLACDREPFGQCRGCGAQLDVTGPKRGADTQQDPSWRPEQPPPETQRGRPADRWTTRRARAARPSPR